MDILGPAGRALQRYIALHRRIGKWAGPLALGALPVVALLLFFFAASVSLCGEGCGLLSAFFLVPLIYASFAAFVAGLALLLARRTLRRMRRDVVVTTAMRVQSLKDWFVRGDIHEPEYEQLRQRMVSISEGTAPHVQAQDAAAFYRRFAAVLWATLVPALAFFMISFMALMDGQMVALPFAFVAFIGVSGNGLGIYSGLRHGRTLHAASPRIGVALMREIDDAEAQLLRTANHRKGGSPSPPPQPYRRATYQAFSGR